MIDTLVRSGGKGGLRTPHADPVAPLGECFFDNDQNELWFYGRADATLLAGEALAPKVWAQVSDGLAAGGAPAGGNTITDANGGFNALLVRVPSDGMKFRQNPIIMIVSGTGKGQRGTILKYTDTVLTVYWHGTIDGTLTTALDATSDYRIVIPWLLVKATNSVCSFAQVQVANAGHYFWSKVEGDGIALAGAANAGAGPLSLDGTAGRVKDYAAADVLPIIGHGYTDAADGDLLFANLAANIRVAKVADVGKGAGYQQSYKHPTL